MSPSSILSQFCRSFPGQILLNCTSHLSGCLLALLKRCFLPPCLEPTLTKKNHIAWRSACLTLWLTQISSSNSGVFTWCLRNRTKSANSFKNYIMLMLTDFCNFWFSVDRKSIWWFTCKKCMQMYYCMMSLKSISISINYPSTGTIDKFLSSD